MRHSPLVILVAALALAIAAPLTASAAPAAHAAAPTIDVAIPYSGSQTSFTVPDGVTSIVATLKAGSGADGIGAVPQPGGAGGAATVQFSVTPGEVLRILVGQQGFLGFNGVVGGSPPGLGFQGGGGTFIGTDARGILYAVGGGGGGTVGPVGVIADQGGSGAGGNSGLPGPSNPASGIGATETAPGAAGVIPASPPTCVQDDAAGTGGGGPAALSGGVITPGIGGHASGSASGGGGGGGFGGGGGASASRNCPGGMVEFRGAGGGGSAFQGAGVTFLSPEPGNIGDGSVELSFTQTPTLTLGSATVQQGTSLQVDAYGLDASTGYDIVLHSNPVVVAHVTTSATGTFSTTVVIPSATAPGAHTITVGALSSALTVTGVLAATGTDDSGPLAALASGLLGLGALVIGLVAVRRRRTRIS